MNLRVQHYLGPQVCLGIHGMLYSSGRFPRAQILEADELPPALTL